MKIDRRYFAIFGGLFLVVLVSLIVDSKKPDDLSAEDKNQIIGPQKLVSAEEYFSKGSAWYNKGELDKALGDYNEAIRLNPKYTVAYYNRGVTWDNKGEYEKAIADYNEAIRLDPKYADAYYGRGNTWGRKSEYDKAIADFNKAIWLNPKDAEAFFSRGVAWKRNGELSKTIADYKEAIRLNPKYAEAYNNLAWIQATSPNATFRDGTTAVENATRACELNQWKNANDLDTLAVAYSAAGKYAMAVKWGSKALDIAPPEYDKEAAKKRLKLYKSDKPYRAKPVAKSVKANELVAKLDRVNKLTKSFASPNILQTQDSNNVVSLLLGRKLFSYKKHGFKDIEFGKSFQSVHDSEGLNWIKPSNPCIFLDKARNEYMFDQNRRLIAYTQSYSGKPNKFVQPVVDMFGKTNQEILTSKYADSNFGDVTVRNVIRYHFPKVYVRIVFSSTHRADRYGVVETGHTFINVTDRDWITARLSETGKAKRERFKWIRNVADLVESQKISKQTLPKLAGCVLRAAEDKKQGTYFREYFFEDRVKAKRNKELKKTEQLPTIVTSISFRPTNIWTASRLDTYQWNIKFDFRINAYDSVKGIYNQKDYEEKYKTSQYLRINAVSITHFSDLITEMNSIYGQMYFPPMGDKITYKEKSGSAFYEWKTKDGWTVRAGLNVVSLTWAPKAKL